MLRPILLLLCYCSSSSAFSSSLSISAAISFQRSHHYAISESSDGGQQRGMEEAFASLEALSPSDWNADEKLNSNDKDDEMVDLKFSPTDDTGASTYGKATREEVEHYLEMTTELDGTAAQNMEFSNTVETMKFLNTAKTTKYSNAVELANGATTLRYHCGVVRFH